MKITQNVKDEIDRSSKEMAQKTVFDDTSIKVTWTQHYLYLSILVII